MSGELPFSLEPTHDKRSLRRQLQAERQAMLDRHQRAVHLQEVLRVWLVGRSECSIGAYWPIKGEFDLSKSNPSPQIPEHSQKIQTSATF